HWRILGTDPHHRRVRVGLHPPRGGPVLLGVARPVLDFGRRAAGGYMDAPISGGDPRVRRGGRGSGEGGTQSIAHGREPRTDSAGLALAREFAKTSTAAFRAWALGQHLP